ncbi:MAG: YggT family protein [Rickettsiales bacterium]
MNPFIRLIGNIISVIDFALLVWVILGLLIHFDVVNRYNPLIQRIYATLGRALEPMLRPIRRLCNQYLPDMGGLDLSPLILFLLLHFLADALYDWFYVI